MKLNPLVACLILAFASPAVAGTLGPGQRGEVNAGDAPESWSLSGAELVVGPGASTLDVNATANSNVTFNQASAFIPASGSTLGIRVIGGSILQMNDTTVRSDSGRALSVNYSSGATPNGGGTARILRSNLFGTGIGAVVSGGTTLEMDASSVEGSAVSASDPFDAGSGLWMSGGATVVARNGSTIIGDTYGIAGQFDVRFTPEDPADVVIDGSTVEGRTGAAIYIDADGSRDPFLAAFTIRNGAQLRGGDGNIVLVNGDGADITLAVDSSQLQGNIDNTGASVIDVSLSGGATLIGATRNITSMALENARWQLTENSTAGTLALGAGSEIALGDGSAFHTLDVRGNYSGNGGTLLFNTVLAGDDAASDKLVIGGDTSGQTNVRVNNVGGAGAQTVNGIELITVAGASNGQFNLAGRAVGGQYDYFLFKDAGNWYLRSQLPTAPDPCDVDPTLPGCGGGVDPVDPVDPVEPPVPVLRPEGGAYLANLQATQTLFRMGYHDRHAGQNNGRAWARVDGSRTGFDAVSRQLDVQGNSQSLSVGADVWRNDTGSGAGVMLSSGNATSTSTNPLSGYYARGKVKGEALGVYGTWRAGNAMDPYAGFYLDGSLQRAQFRNRVEGVGLATERYDSRGWQGAIETGYAFRVRGSQIFLEPQLQVGYNRWDELRHAEANGTVVTTQDADGLYGRVGLRLSGVTRWGDGAADVQPYIAANWLHTRAESQVWMDDERVDARIPRSRAEVSAGASLKFANGFGAWAGLARQQASSYHQTSAQLGMSYSW
jgi:autotransporter family porin